MACSSFDLAPVNTLDAAVQTMVKACALWSSDALGGGGMSAVDRLLTTLAQRKCLLLIDNCEHLVDVVADLLGQILARCGHVVLLATSREALSVEGEQLMQVPSLAVPDEGAPVEIADSMRLFADRARAVKRTFDLDANTLAAVARSAGGSTAFPWRSSLPRHV